MPERNGQLLVVAPDSGAPVISFDPGLRGLHAIFALPTAFLDAPPTEQLPWFRQRVYPQATELHRDEDVRAMTWTRARALVEAGHRICSHGTSHMRIDASTPAAVVLDEVQASRATLEQRVPHAVVDGFCWPIRFDPAAAEAERLVRDTYAYALCGESGTLRRADDPYRIRRTNIEVSWPVEVVDLQLSGLVDVRFALQRLMSK